MAGETGSPSEHGEAAARTEANYHAFGKRPLRTFVLFIGLPAFLLYVLSVAVVIGGLVMMAQEMDRLEEQRGLTAMAAALETFLNGLSDNVADEGTWNEAHLNVVVELDPAWMDETWGATARLGESYDDAIVTDQEGNIIFGENNLGPIRGVIADHYAAASSMLGELDRAITSSGDAAVVAHYSSDKNNATVALAAISVHRSTPGEMAVPRHQRKILWISKRVTPVLLQDIAARYQVPLPQIVSVVEPGQSSIAIGDGSGNIAGIVAWTPDRPGDIAFRHAAILASGVLFVIGVALVAGLGALRRQMVQRAARIEAAFTEQMQDIKIAVAAAEVVARQAAVIEEAHSSTVEGVSASDFTVEYQPIFDLRSEAMIGVEGLLRWNKPDRTILLQEELPPADCATLMERASIMALRHASSEVAPLLGMTLSLAVTPDQLRNNVFMEKVGATLGATNFQIKRLQLNVDATLLPDLAQMARYLEDVRRMGITLALSNFSLSDRTVPFMHEGIADRIFLARSMVAGIDADPVRLKLVEATIEAARLSSLAVTAPNVERKEEATRLLRLGCREFRGSLLASPMPLAALTALILAPARPAKTG